MALRCLGIGDAIYATEAATELVEGEHTVTTIRYFSAMENLLIGEFVVRIF